jgi:hypothetical protein
MKKFVLACFLLLAVASASVAASAHDGGHHAEPGYGFGHGCALPGGFHNYDHNNYGTGAGHNVWCDGSNPQLAPHHGGDIVSADLPIGDSFVGGFCMKANVPDGTPLDIRYKDVVAHNKVWLKSSDSSYYPIDRAAGETSIRVEDNGWADRNPAVGQVEAEVLFSASNRETGTPPAGRQDGGGGCNLAGSGSWLGAALLLVALSFSLRKRG